MGRPVGGIFINYRGEDSRTAAALIDRELVEQFGNDHVFLDNRSIPAGVDFVKKLLGRLRACSVLLVVIGPQWLTLTDETGGRRIDNPRDWTHREIVEALTHDLRVIPVLIDEAKLPTERDLPADIAELSRRQYVHLRRRYSATDLTLLVAQITRADPTLVPAVHRDRPAARQALPMKSRRLVIAGGALILLLAGSVFVATFLVERARDKGTPPSSAPTVLDLPGGGGFAEVDQERRNVTVCDTDANSRGVGASYTVSDGSGTIHHIGDGNGSNSGCGHDQLDTARIVSIQVCESDSTTHADLECTDWRIL